MTAVGGSSPIWMYQEPASSRTVCEPLMRWLRSGGGGEGGIVRGYVIKKRPCNRVPVSGNIVYHAGYPTPRPV